MYSLVMNGISVQVSDIKDFSPRRFLLTAQKHGYIDDSKGLVVAAHARQSDVWFVDGITT